MEFLPEAPVPPELPCTSPTAATRSFHSFPELPPHSAVRVAQQAPHSHSPRRTDDGDPRDFGLRAGAAPALLASPTTASVRASVAPSAGRPPRARSPLRRLRDSDDSALRPGPLSPASDAGTGHVRQWSHGSPHAREVRAAPLVAEALTCPMPESRGSSSRSPHGEGPPLAPPLAVPTVAWNDSYSGASCSQDTTLPSPNSAAEMSTGSCRPPQPPSGSASSMPALRVGRRDAVTSFPVLALGLHTTPSCGGDEHAEPSSEIRPELIAGPAPSASSLPAPLTLWPTTHDDDDDDNADDDDDVDDASPSHHTSELHRLPAFGAGSSTSTCRTPRPPSTPASPGTHSSGRSFRLGRADPLTASGSSGHGTAFSPGHGPASAHSSHGHLAPSRSCRLGTGDPLTASFELPPSPPRPVRLQSLPDFVVASDTFSFSTSGTQRNASCSETQQTADFEPPRTEQVTGTDGTNENASGGVMMLDRTSEVPPDMVAPEAPFFVAPSDALGAEHVPPAPVSSALSAGSAAAVAAPAVPLQSPGGRFHRRSLAPPELRRTGSSSGVAVASDDVDAVKQRRTFITDRAIEHRQSSSPSSTCATAGATCGGGGGVVVQTRALVRGSSFDMRRLPRHEHLFQQNDDDLDTFDVPWSDPGRGRTARASTSSPSSAPAPAFAPVPLIALQEQLALPSPRLVRRHASTKRDGAPLPAWSSHVPAEASSTDSGSDEDNAASEVKSRHDGSASALPEGRGTGRPCLAGESLSSTTAEVSSTSGPTSGSLAEASLDLPVEHQRSETVVVPRPSVDASITCHAISVRESPRAATMMLPQPSIDASTKIDTEIDTDAPLDDDGDERSFHSAFQTEVPPRAQQHPQAARGGLGLGPSGGHQCRQQSSDPSTVSSNSASATDPFAVEDEALIVAARRQESLPFDALPYGHLSFMTVTTLKFTPRSGAELKAVVHAAPGLTSLDVSGAAAVPGGAFGCLMWARSLESLDVSRTSFGDGGAAAVATLPGLQRLDVSWTRVRRGGTRHLLQCPALVSLEADGVEVDPEVSAAIEDRIFSQLN